LLRTERRYVQAVVAVPDPDTVRKYGNRPEQIPLRKVAGLTLDHLTDGFAIDSKAEIAEAEELLLERSGEPASPIQELIVAFADLPFACSAAHASRRTPSLSQLSLLPSYRPSCLRVEPIRVV
jgi:hypothetical protein